jgi:hypothetical protein
VNWTETKNGAFALKKMQKGDTLLRVMAGHSRSKNGVLFRTPMFRPSRVNGQGRTPLSGITGTSPVMTKKKCHGRVVSNQESGVRSQEQPAMPAFPKDGCTGSPPLIPKDGGTDSPPLIPANAGIQNPQLEY